MMRKLKVGVVGLGAIAQKAYLPILTKEENWELIGAFSPNQLKAKLICDSYRIPLFSHIDALAQQCDAIFVHSATKSHSFYLELLKLPLKPIEEGEPIVNLRTRRA